MTVYISPEAEIADKLDADYRTRFAGTRIDVHYAVLPALARNRKPDPVFFFAGGPGQSAMDVGGSVSRMLARLGYRRDVVLIERDAPGKGASYGNMASIAVTEFMPGGKTPGLSCRKVAMFPWAIRFSSRSMASCSLMNSLSESQSCVWYRVLVASTTVPLSVRTELVPMASIWSLSAFFTVS